MRQVLLRSGGVLLIFVSSATQALARPYLVRRGETLSKIAADHFAGPIYGSNGSLTKLLVLNPEIKNPNRIHVNQGIELDEPTRPLAQKSHPDTSEAPIRAPATVAQEFAASPESRSEAPERPYSLFEIDPTFSYARMDTSDKTNGGSATFLSSLDPGFEFSWSQAWNKNWESFIGMSLRHESFGGPAGKSLNNPDQTVTDLSIGTRFRFSDQLTISGHMGMTQQIFSRGSSATAVSLDSISIPEVSAALQYDFIRIAPFTVGVAGGAGYFFPGTTDTYAINSGGMYFLGLSLRQDVGASLAINTRAYYEYSTQDTSIAAQKTQQVGAALGFDWTLGK